MGWISYAGKDTTVSSATEIGAEKQDFSYTQVSYDKNYNTLVTSKICFLKVTFQECWFTFKTVYYVILYVPRYIKATVSSC